MFRLPCYIGHLPIGIENPMQCNVNMCIMCTYVRFVFIINTGGPRCNARGPFVYIILMVWYGQLMDIYFRHIIGHITSIRQYEIRANEYLIQFPILINCGQLFFDSMDFFFSFSFFFRFHLFVRKSKAANK